MGGVFNVVNLHLYHYAGNNPVKYVDPDGEFFGIGLLLLTAKAGERIMPIVDNVSNFLNSGEHKKETKSNTPTDSGAKAMYASAAADARLNKGQLNLNAEAGVVDYSPKEKIIVETKGKALGIALEGGVSAAGAKGYVGLKDSALGAEAGVALNDFSGSLNIKVLGRAVKIGGCFGVGAATIGASIGLKNTVKLGLGVSVGAKIEFVPKAEESSL
jgi:hypothetical protein